MELGQNYLWSKCYCKSLLLKNFKIVILTAKEQKRQPVPQKEAADQMIEGLKKELMAKQASLQVHYLNIYKFYSLSESFELK